MPHKVICVFYHRHQRYVHVLVYFLGDFVEILGGDASYSFCHFLGVYPPFVVHEVVGDGLGDIVLSLVMQDLVVDLSLAPFELLIRNSISVVWIGHSVPA